MKKNSRPSEIKNKKDAVSLFRVFYFDFKWISLYTVLNNALAAERKNAPDQSDTSFSKSLMLKSIRLSVSSFPGMPPIGKTPTESERRIFFYKIYTEVNTSERFFFSEYAADRKDTDGIRATYFFL